jgi:hypothetical protein
VTDRSAAGDESQLRPREQLLTETFVALADTLVDDFDIVDMLHQLVTASVRLLGVTEAGLILMDQKGGLAVLGSSSEEARLLELFQVQMDEGPCVDSIRGG